MLFKEPIFQDYINVIFVGTKKFLYLQDTKNILKKTNSKKKLFTSMKQTQKT